MVPILKEIPGLKVKSKEVCRPTEVSEDLCDFVRSFPKNTSFKVKFSLKSKKR